MESGNSLLRDYSIWKWFCIAMVGYIEKKEEEKDGIRDINCVHWNLRVKFVSNPFRFCCFSQTCLLAFKPFFSRIVPLACLTMVKHTVLHMCLF